MGWIFISCDEDVVVGGEDVALDAVALTGVALVDDFAQDGAPALDLRRPVRNGAAVVRTVGHGGDVRGTTRRCGPLTFLYSKRYAMRAMVCLLASAMRAGGERYLKGLAQAHFVCKDAVEVVVVEGDEPLQPLELVRPQLAVVED